MCKVILAEFYGRRSFVKRIATLLALLDENGAIIGVFLTGDNDIAEAVLLEVDHVDERDEMDAAVVERIPAAAGRALAEAPEIGVSRLGVENVMFARL